MRTVWQIIFDSDNYAVVAPADDWHYDWLLKASGASGGVPERTIPASVLGEDDSHPLGDFARFTNTVFYCPLPASERVSQFLADEVRTFDVDIPGIEGRGFVVRNEVDCIDPARSAFVHVPGTAAVRMYTRIVIRSDAVRDSALFVAPGLANSFLFCTDRFRSFVESNALTGLLFKHVGTS